MDGILRAGGAVTNSLCFSPIRNRRTECAFAERIRTAAETMERHGVTLSTGVATNTKAEPLASVIERADAAIDDAKQAGRNTVVFA